MTDTLEESSLEPLKMRRHSFSLVWIVPIVAILIGLWVGWLSWSERGFEIEILFKDVSGLEEGKSKVRYRNLDVGTVTKLEFAEDARQVKATIEMKKGASRFLSKDTRFWVVRARLGVGRVSGLETLLSGSYIAMDLQTGEADGQREFTGLEAPPAAFIDEPGSRFNLYAVKRGGVSIGSPVFYRNIEVGTVTDVHFDFSRYWVSIEVFVREPYDKLVTMNTVFWNASGFSANLGTNGVVLNVESVEALLTGGVAFGLPKDADIGERAKSGFLYHLYPNKEQARKQRNKNATRYLLYFDESVRGLSVGSSVEYSGLQIGEVLSIGAEYDPKTLDVRVPVMIEIERKMFRSTNPEVHIDDALVLTALLKKGLRASLASANLLTGGKFIEMAFIPDAPEPKPLTGVKPAFPVIPTVSGGLANIQNRIGSLVTKLDELPIESLGKNMNETLANSAQAMQSLGILLSPQSKLQLTVFKTLNNFGETSKAIRDLSKTIEQNPQSIIWGKPGKKGNNAWPAPQSAFPK